MLHLPTHTGALPDHTPVSEQVRELSPIKEYPEIQLYVAVSQYLVPLVLTMPLRGESSSPQSEAVKVVVDKLMQINKNFYVHKQELIQTKSHLSGTPVCLYQLNQILYHRCN